MQPALNQEVQARIERNRRLAKAKRLRAQLLEKLAAEGKLVGSSLNQAGKQNVGTASAANPRPTQQPLVVQVQPPPSCQFQGRVTLTSGQPLPLQSSLTTNDRLLQTGSVQIPPKPYVSLSERLNIKCELISAHTVLMVAPPHNKLDRLFQAMGCKYDAGEKGFKVPIQNYAGVVSQLKQHGDIAVQALPELVQRVFLRRDNHGPNTHYVDTWVPDLLGDLLPFQLEAVRKSVRWGRVLIADDMGLGKTIQAIAVATYFRMEWPVLVICPSSVRFTWEEAFLEWVPKLSPEKVTVITSARDQWSDAQVVIVSYEMMSRLAESMKRATFRIVIADESHMLKNAKAKRSDEILPILKSADRVVLLSGTPALSRPSELFTQLKAVRPDIFKSFPEFAMRYCAGRVTTFGLEAKGASHLRELETLLRSCVMIRRLKSEVAMQLPDKFRQQIYLKCDIAQLRRPRGVGSKDSEVTFGNFKPDSCYLQMYKDTAEAKTEAVCQYVIRLLETGAKFLVFAHHSVMLDAVESTVSMQGVGYIRIDGRTAPEARKRLADMFQSDPSCQVAVLSIMAANAGITLTAASTVVFAELHWNPGILMQAEDRVHRIGQDRCVNIQYLLAKGTLDSDMWTMLLAKLSVLSSAGLNKADLKGGEEMTPTQGIAIMASETRAFTDAVGGD